MKSQATHFIEQYVDHAGRELRSPELMPINKLAATLKVTKEAKTLTTVAVWKIKFKHQNN